MRVRRSEREIERIERPRVGRKERLKAGVLTWSLSFSICCLIVGIILAVRGNSTDCITFLQWSFISISLAFMAAFLVFVAFGRGGQMKDDSITCHLCIKFLALIVLLCLMLVAFVSINIKYKEDGDKPPESVADVKARNKPHPIREYNLSDYRGLLRRRMAHNPHYWASISSCLRRRHACRGMSPLVRDPNTGELLAERPSKKYPYDLGLSPIESGCCKPPLSCAFTYVNQTTWTTPAPADGRLAKGEEEEEGINVDCSRWNNDPQTLCFECNSCKAGVLADIQRAWGKPVIIFTTIVVAQICMFPVVCCLFFG